MLPHDLSRSSSPNKLKGRRWADKDFQGHPTNAFPQISSRTRFQEAHDQQQGSRNENPNIQQLEGAYGWISYKNKASVHHNLKTKMFTLEVRVVSGMFMCPWIHGLAGVIPMRIPPAWLFSLWGIRSNGLLLFLLTSAPSAPRGAGKGEKWGIRYKSWTQIVHVVDNLNSSENGRRRIGGSGVSPAGEPMTTVLKVAWLQ